MTNPNVVKSFQKVTAICPACRESGRCVWCEGSGYDPDLPSETLFGEPCPACSGDGECQECAGSGTVVMYA